MKNVLLTTTALVAFAGTAFAAAHEGGPVLTFSGAADLGYNDDINGGVFLDSDFTIGGTVDLGDGYMATFSYGFDVDTSNGGGTDGTNLGLQWDDFPTVEVTSPYGSLKIGDLDDKGASEYFYADRDGMAQDVENHDNDTETNVGVRALVEFGSIGIALGGEMDTSSNDLDGFNVGVGATFGNFTLGLGYDEADAQLVGDDDDASDVIAVSADTTFGAASIGLSYASGSEDSIGLAVGYDISSSISVAAYYANNSVSDDEYGVSLAYASGPIGLDVYYEGGAGAFVETYGVDVSYEINADLTAFAGYKDDAGTDQYYAGIEYAINDKISATVSYSDGDEVSGPEFKDGTSIFLSVSF